MRYAYYPGCSLKESAREYDASTRAVMEALGAEIHEIPDWTCCGASAAESVDGLLAYALPARNLALAEKHTPGLDILAPCAACYLNLLKTQMELPGDRRLTDMVGETLAGEGLEPPASGGRARHLLDVLKNDVGAETLRSHVRRDLGGLVVAPYYGCQPLRPYPVFDNPERPVSMEPLLRALGAKVHDWSSGGVCCGASLMTTHKEAALPSVARILAAAEGAHAVVTVCPMCQLNLEAFQKQASRASSKAGPVTVLYLSQLIALAMDLPKEATRLDGNMAVTEAFLSELRRTGAVVPA